MCMAFLIILTVEDIKSIILLVFILWIIFILIERFISFVVRQVRSLFETKPKQKREERFRIYFCNDGLYGERI